MSELGQEMAFNQVEIDSEFGVKFRGGLSKREYFAGLALQGLLARGDRPMLGKHSADAVYIADALLAELAKEPTE